jgi:hypothetical protein
MSTFAPLFHVKTEGTARTFRMAMVVPVFRDSQDTTVKVTSTSVLALPAKTMELAKIISVNMSASVLWNLLELAVKWNATVAWREVRVLIVTLMASAVAKATSKVINVTSVSADSSI